MGKWTSCLVEFGIFNFVLYNFIFLRLLAMDAAITRKYWQIGGYKKPIGAAALQSSLVHIIKRQMRLVEICRNLELKDAQKY